MQVEQLFREASGHFEDSNYEAGLELMSRCIHYSPKNSALYSNRALFHSQLGNIDAAVDDLVNAINYNYLNYVAYFNLFSLQFNAGQIFPAFDNLCCSLSCLYLVRARKARRELDVQRSIKYAENNPEAHILKALMYLEDGKNKLALNEIQWALDIQVHISLCIKIKNIINRRLNPYAMSEIYEDTSPKTNFRLHTSYEPAEEYDEEIRQRVHEFNQIYDELVNSEYGTITQKVPRIKPENDVSNVNHSHSKLLSEISQIYEIKYRDLNHNRQSKEKSSEAATKENLPNENNESDLLIERHIEEISLQNLNQVEEQAANHQTQEENLLDDDSLNRLEEQFKRVQKYEPEEEKEEIIDNHLLIGEQNLLESNPQQQEETKEEPLLEEEENLLSIQAPAEPVAVESTKIQNHSPLNIAHASRASSANSEPISLYPIGNKKKIQFTIISAEIKNPIKQKDLYLTGKYNSRKGQRLKTPNKKIQNNLVKWSTSIAPTSIAQTMQTVSVKVFSKQYYSYDDDLIGEGEIEIIKSGQMKFPIYFKNKVTGFVNLRVDLI